MVQLLGKDVGTTGYGMMGLSWRPEPQPLEESITTLKAALEKGCNFWNGGEFYGTPEYNSLTICAAYFDRYPEDADKVVLSVKGGLNLEKFAPDGSPEGVRKSVDKCLALLNGKKKIDIFECARVDKDTPIEVTMKVLEEEYVKTGKIGGISLSECSAETVRRAAKVTKIVACEVEVALNTLDIFQNGVAEACREHDILVVAYSPLGRGLLTGAIQKPEDLPEGDVRRTYPRFQGEHFENNKKLLDAVTKIAEQKNCTPAQIAINWLKAISKKDGNPEIIPIPGATTVDRITENAKEVSLSAADLAVLDSILKQFPGSGHRYPEHAQKHLEG
ncbi:Pyridoxal reductase [Botrytis cinerea]